ncbi:hypothetical protein DXH78_06610 [Undibacter mobilis]|uniref:Uncharacterized protein n=2 Tax=Undibacter mobilis TaxID=2292256 RepID=A0A371B9J3_9BRAD|nr:hypothetical protein DXH78_06610 [Undibacter mobilis]
MRHSSRQLIAVVIHAKAAIEKSLFGKIEAEVLHLALFVDCVALQEEPKHPRVAISWKIRLRIDLPELCTNLDVPELLIRRVIAKLSHSLIGHRRSNFMRHHLGQLFWASSEIALPSIDFRHGLRETDFGLGKIARA